MLEQSNLIFKGSIVEQILQHLAKKVALLSHQNIIKKWLTLHYEAKENELNI